MHKSVILTYTSITAIKQQLRKTAMTKLLNAFQAAPTDANRARLAKYLAAHMMALCMATPEQVAFLRANNFKGV